jgi:hypothetical protein
MNLQADGASQEQQVMQIEKITIPSEFFVSDYWASIYETAQKQLEDLANWDHTTGDLVAIVSNPVFVTERLATLHIEYKRESLTRDYERYLTSAPKEYDYDYTLHLGDLDEKRRIVAIPIKSAEYQTGRYRSGLYASEKV